MNFNLKTKASILALLALSACGPKSPNEKESLITETQTKKTVDLNKAGNKPADAEEVANLGWSLLTGPGSVHAKRFALKALSIDSKNPKARLLMAITEPLERSRGIHNRIKPFLKKADPRAYNQLLAEISSFPESDIKKFLLDGQQNIQTESQAQDFLGSIQSALQASRQELATLANEELSVTVTTYSPNSETPKDGILASCAVKQLSYDVFEIKKCSEASSQTVALNYADIEALRIGMGYMIAVSSIYTSYSLEGALDAQKEINDAQFLSQIGEKKVTFEQGMKILRSKPNLLRLRDGKTLSSLLGIGTEYVRAVKMAQEQADLLCKTGEISSSNRPGFLFAQGFCVTAEALKTAANVHKAASGAFAQQVRGYTWVKTPYGWSPEAPVVYNTRVNPKAFFDGNIQDLRQVLPSEFNSCGEPKSLPDTTMGGVTPNADMEVIIKLNTPYAFDPVCSQVM